MSVVREVCPFHADEDVRGVATGYGDGSLTFSCTRRGHPLDGPHTWLRVPVVEAGPGGRGLAAELGLATELPAAVKTFAGHWVEYGLVERAYATRRPADFAHLVSRFGHTALMDKRNTASAFLAGYLASLAKRGNILYHDGPATGRWSYNSKISWWAVPPPSRLGRRPAVLGGCWPCRRLRPERRRRRRRSSRLRAALTNSHYRPVVGVTPFAGVSEIGPIPTAPNVSLRPPSGRCSWAAHGSQAHAASWPVPGTEVFSPASAVE